MANNHETTTKFKVDISELKSAMQEAKRAVSVANSEFKAVSSSMDDWSKSSEGLSAKLKQLDTNLKSQKTILANLEHQYELTVKEMGEGSAAADRLKIAINNQQAAINKTEKEISQYEKALEEVGEAEKKAAKTGKDVSEVLDEMRKGAEDAGDGFTTLKGAIATFAGNMLTQLVDGVKNGISAFVGLAEETREYRTELAKMNAAAETAGASADYIKEKWHDMGAVLGDEGAVAEGLNNLMAAGYTTQTSIDTITKYLEGAAIKWKDTLKFEGLADGLQETLATGEAVGPFAELLERAGVSLDVFNEGLATCKTEAEQQNYVMQQLSRLGLAEVSDAYRSQNKDLIEANKANSDYTDTMAELGELIEPVTTAIKKGFTAVINKGRELVGDVDIELFVKKIEKGFGILTDEVLPAIKDGFGWLIANKDKLIAAASAIAAGFVAFKAVTAISSAITFVKGLGSAMAVLKTAMAAMGGPVTIIITLIAALVAGFITLWNTSDEFRAFWLNLWESLKASCSAAKDWIAEKIGEIAKFFTETLPQAINVLVEWFKGLPNRINEHLKTAFSKIATWAADTTQRAKEAGSEFLRNIVTFFQQLPGKVADFMYQALVAITATLIAIPILAYNHGKEFLENLIEWFKQLPGKVEEWLTVTIANVTTWANEMKSTAKKTASNFIETVVSYIKQLPEKVWTWLQNVISKVTTWTENMTAKAKQAASQFVDNVVLFVSELPGKIQTWLNDVISKVTSWASSLAAKGREAARELVDSVVDKISELPQAVEDVGENLVRGIWNGISNMGSWIKNKISGFVGDVESWLKDFFGIASPSKLMEKEVGRWLPEGIAVGIDKNAKSVLSSVKSLATDTVGAAKSELSVVGRTVSAVGGRSAGGVVNNFYQTINSPKQLNRLDIYRNSKNLLGYAGGAR